MKIDKLNIVINYTRQEMGENAGNDAVTAIKKAIAEKGKARVIFAAAPSQNETLQTMVKAKDVDWTCVTALHMDEYIGLPANSPARFSHYLQKHLFGRLPFKTVRLIDDPAENMTADELVRRYETFLGAKPVDVVCLGIGENGHIAFNDPPVADFEDPRLVKVVELDEVCRQQQVNDGCFPNLKAVPQEAITLTIPSLFKAGCLVCAVPGATKRDAVYKTLTGPISTDCPASILRTHQNATLFVDTDSCDAKGWQE